jgi:hypothetical protein
MNKVTVASTEDELQRATYTLNNQCIYGSTALLKLSSFFSFLIYTQSIALLGRGISLSQDRYLHTEQHKENKRTYTFTPRMGFEPTIPVLERAKTVYALDPAITVIGTLNNTAVKYCDMSTHCQVTTG